ncbi:MAG: hypothetical protein H6936_00395 [Burkholderiales bacterium]|nr:hypothetical protein [Nitrosomonas sp.]MCP5273314.1 hypothetical protein [Burkholderiales bacterium]
MRTNDFWSRLFAQGLSEFNRISDQSHLGIRLERSRDLPSESQDGADIMVSASNGNIPRGYPGSSQTIHFNGTGLHGRTFSLSRSPGGLFKCFVHVPSSPQVSIGVDRRRRVGRPIGLCILVHEFIHCCGLSNDEHVPIGTRGGGIFCFPGEVITGSRAEEDGLRPWGTSDPLMPPLILDSITADRIRTLWQQTPSSQEQQFESSTEEIRYKRGPMGVNMRPTSESEVGVADKGISSRSWRKPGPFV